MNAQTNTPAYQYALLYIDSAYLSFPQQQVTVVDLASGVNPTDRSGGEVGRFADETRGWPIYDLASDLTLNQELSPKRRFVVGLGAPGATNPYGLACDAVETITLPNEALFPLPGCMYTRATPIRQIYKYANKLVVLSDAESMGAYLLEAQNRDD